MNYLNHCVEMNGFEVEDSNLDGHLDLAFSSGCGTSVYAGLGNGEFSHDYLFSCGYDPCGLVSEDFDLDEDHDPIISEPDYVRCYRNTTVNLGVEESESALISNLSLEVFPNPFSTEVTVSTSVLTTCNLQVFDLSGRLIVEMNLF